MDTAGPYCTITSLVTKAFLARWASLLVLAQLSCLGDLHGFAVAYDDVSLWDDLDLKSYTLNLHPTFQPDALGLCFRVEASICLKSLAHKLKTRPQHPNPKLRFSL